MSRILLAIGASMAALMISSCCCTGEPKPPRLRPLPRFQEIPAAPEVIPAK